MSSSDSHDPFGGRTRSSLGWSPPSAQELQTMLPQYEISGLLGRGGMGAVYKGRQIALDRPVAIKILPPNLVDDDSQYADRFKREAKSMARLSHPGIVAVHDAGETPDGLLYFVMEFIDGTDVHQMIVQQGFLEPAHAVAITAHVCDALQYAHERGIIHRDIKPANIMVGYDGVVKVADFGLAKMAQTGESGLTQSGVIMGTLHYMAPEALVLGSDVDHRADIYAVGIMLYQMLTGRLPQGLFEMPSQKVPGLDPRYDAVIAKAIREDRDIRYQSAAELRADLDSILTQPVVKVDPAATQTPAALPTVARPRKPQAAPVAHPPKSNSLLWATVVAFAVIITSGAFFLLQPDKTSQKTEKPAEPPPQASATAPTTNAVPEKADPASPASPPTVTVEKKSVPEQPRTTPALAVAKSAPVGRIVARPNLPAIPLPPELEKQIASFEAEFQKAVQGKPETDWQAAMRDLDQKYLAAIDRASAEATAKGQLDSVLALKAEKQLLEQKQPVPSELDEATQATPTPQSLQKIRSIYRAEQAKHDNAKSQAIAAAFDDYRNKLTALQTSLTQAGKIEEAVQLKPVFDLLNERKQHDTAVVQSSASFINSLGMRFVSLPGTKTLMCVHETRYIDYATFARDDPGAAGKTWLYLERNEYIKAPYDAYPATDVSFHNVSAFCAWLSKKEGRKYRLPTDREWSIAVGCAEAEVPDLGSTPSALHSATANLFPWGGEWPPPPRSGNYRDLTAWTEFPMKDIFSKPEYVDGVLSLAIVMSFRPNKFGIYDLGGNVLEWCEDWYDETKTKKVARGSCWYRGANNKAYLNSRSREAVAPSFFNNGYGFRVVVEARSDTSAPVVAGIIKESSGVTNSLGMKFVPVDGANVLFCTTETRFKDYAAYAADVSGVDQSWKDQGADGFVPVSREDEHPVTKVSWEDARKFCEWLSKKEGKTYRLPTDQEWSAAVGIARDETRTSSTTPAMVTKVAGRFPWGTQWPPPKGSGNFSDESRKAKAPGNNAPYLSGYDDGFPTTAPVASFTPNQFGIYDLGGNVWEWCEDWYDSKQKERVLRGGSWLWYVNGYLLSSHRIGDPPGNRAPASGFRVVLVSPAPAGSNLPTTPSIIKASPTVASQPLSQSSILPVAVVFGKSGSARVIRAEGKALQAGISLAKGDEVAYVIRGDEVIQTGPSSSVDLALQGGGSVRLDAESELSIRGGISGMAGSVIELSKGRLHFQFNRKDLVAGDKATLHIKGPVALMTVDDGSGSLEIEEQYETIRVFKGAADVLESSVALKKTVFADHSVAVKKGAISPPRRLAGADVALARSWDDIQLVRVLIDMEEIDTGSEKSFEDNYFYPNVSAPSYLEGYATLERTKFAAAATKGALLRFKDNNPPNVRSRTIWFRPHLRMPNNAGQPVALESSYRSQDVHYIRAYAHALAEDKIAYTDASSDRQIDSEVQFQPKSGMTAWQPWLFALFSDVVTPDRKYLLFANYVYPAPNSPRLCITPGRSEYLLEIGPVVLVSKKKQRDIAK